MLSISHRTIIFVRIEQVGMEVKLLNWSLFIYQQVMHTWRDLWRTVYTESRLLSLCLRSARVLI